MFAKIAVVLSMCALQVICFDLGGPAGFMADCPGMNRSTKLSERTKRSQSVVVIRPSSGILSSLIAEKRCSISASGAECTADHIDLSKRKTQVVIGGYLNSASSILVRSVVQPYLDLGRNVIVVEIFPLLLRTYPVAARVTRPFGALIGEYLASLTEHGLTANRLELLGASLGAHIASYAAEKFWELTGTRLARLSALDPAGPCFRNLPYLHRLNHHVARRVDVLHTNIDGFGIADPLGHVDFYANGGEYQHAIKKEFLLPCLVYCSHTRSAFYWIKAFMNPEKFIAVRCDSVARARRGDCYRTNVTTNLLGPKTDFKKPGIYYLPTNGAPPYYRGKDALKARSLGSNTYLLRVAPDEDIIL
ncbi:lipase member H-A-like [Ostrinia furnacalis]|uniref:lipase member H-A-like n=1 Tax=Ostrinia furnacalis TaxID=93504 RepID=UPI00103E8E28|nr:lipase member H-A-like [Ostrinia furnacalis]